MSVCARRGTKQRKFERVFWLEQMADGRLLLPFVDLIGIVGFFSGTNTSFLGGSSWDRIHLKRFITFGSVHFLWDTADGFHQPLSMAVLPFGSVWPRWRRIGGGERPF